MPALPNPPSPVVKLSVKWGVDADVLAMTVHYFKFSGSASSADLSSFASGAVAQGDIQFGALAANSVGMLSAIARDITTDMGNEVEAGTPWNGTAGTDLLSPGTAVLVNHSIARHYRGGHPRTYLCGVPDNSFDDTRSYTTSFKNAAESAAIAFHGDLEAISGISSGITSVEHGVVSFVNAGAWRTPPIFRRINTAHVDQRVDTQRRRLGPDIA